MRIDKPLEREDILSLPVSIKSWIILRDYINHNTSDLALYKKIIDDYYTECPLFELDNLFALAMKALCEVEYQHIVEYLIKRFRTGIADESVRSANKGMVCNPNHDFSIKETILQDRYGGNV